MSGIGIFSPPSMITRTDERSRCSMPGTSRIASHHRGREPTRWSRATARSRRRRGSASNTRWMIVVAPTAIIVVVTRSSAPTWYSGPHARPTSARGEAELGDVREVLPRQVGVGEHHALRAPGGARRVHQPVDVVARDRRTRPGRATSAPQVGERAPTRRRAVGRDAHPDEVARPGRSSPRSRARRARRRTRARALRSARG